MASVNQTRPHCINQMGKTHSKPLAVRHGRGTAWARHAMCESALSISTLQPFNNEICATIRSKSGWQLLILERVAMKQSES